MDGRKREMRLGRKKVHLPALLTVSMLITLLTGPCFAQHSENSSSQQKSSNKQIEKNKNAEMERLSFLVGDWKYIATHEKKDSNEEAKEEGKYIAHYGPGRNSLIIELHGNGSQGEDVVMDLICWSEKLNSYETVTTGSSFPGMIHGKSHWEKDDFVMEISTSKKIRIIYKRIRDNKMEIEEWFQSGAEPYKLAMRMKVSKT